MSNVNYVAPLAPRRVALPPPDVGIFDAPLTAAGINSLWVSHIAGVIDVLADESVWDGTEADKVAAVQQIEQLLQFAWIQQGSMSMNHAIADTTIEGDNSTTSAVFVEVDPIYSVTLVTGSTATINFAANLDSFTGGSYAAFDVAVDSTSNLVGSVSRNGLGLIEAPGASNGLLSEHGSFTRTVTGLTPGEHTFILMWRRAQGTGTPRLRRPGPNKTYLVQDNYPHFSVWSAVDV